MRPSEHALDRPAVPLFHCLSPFPSFLDMVPVRLTLQNFLSYGEKAPTLEFDTFHVACLSGGNGQGKSALLDAMTWSLWGEARKSSGNRKPDDDLLRIGTQEMEVRFEFALDGVRHLVTRSYYKTASGKSTTSNLEFSVFDETKGEFHSLTAPSMRETQARIDERLGLDYETFINSTFLLQGRSDEFTKKRPAERKEILGKILALDRFDRYREEASARNRAAKKEVERLEAEQARLMQALASESEWKQERAVVAERVETFTTARQNAAEALAAAERALSDLDASAREKVAHEEALASLATQAKQRTSEIEALTGRLDEAEALIARADAVEAAHERHRGLTEERSLLDRKQQRRQEFAEQRQRLRMEMQRKQSELEARVQQMAAKAASERERLSDERERLGNREAIAEKKKAAREAGQEVEELRALRAVRREKERRIDVIDKLLASEMGNLKGRLNELKLRAAALQEKLSEAASLEATRREMQRKVAERETLERRREALREKGAEARAQRESLAKQVGAEARAIENAEARIERLRAETAAECPTCGTELTEVHRETVETSIQAEISTIRDRKSRYEKRLADLDETLEVLRRTYREVEQKRSELESAPAELARVMDRIEQQGELESQRIAAQKDIRELEAQITNQSFRPKLRAERTELEEALRDMPFDEERFNQLQSVAAQADHWARQHRELERVAEQAAARAGAIERMEAERQTLAESLASGEAVAGVKERLAAVEARIEEVDYDGERHEVVRRELAELAEAPADYASLREARRNRSEWTERRKRLLKQAEGALEERERRTAEVERLTKALTERTALARKRDAAKEAEAKAADSLSEAQTRLGALQERLDRCARDRETLATVKRELKAAQRSRSITKHLRSAFGKHGIPSLIIEETLPEIEQRTNELLDRLTDGRTQIALETLAEKKTGGTKETLDIRITDEGGMPRAYETYSGGEAFRVNFALRIALAQMLAERAGTRIRTLVVDEGFGTQDKEGVQNLIASIDRIREDFDKILVVTHLDELKNAFPVRIEVTKEPVTGSTFEIVGA